LSEIGRRRKNVRQVRTTAQAVRSLTIQERT